MVKCPKCGKDVSPEEYGAHYDACGKEGSSPGVSGGSERDLEVVRGKARKALETLSETAAFYRTQGRDHLKDAERAVSLEEGERHLRLAVGFLEHYHERIKWVLDGLGE